MNYNESFYRIFPFSIFNRKNGKANFLFRSAVFSFLTLTLIAAVPQIAKSQRYHLTKLTSDIPGFAPNLDPNLVFGWGLTRSNGGPWWVNNRATGTSTLYNGLGQRFPLANPLVVTIPPPMGQAPPSKPTGLIFNTTPDFTLAPTRPSIFLFTSEDGTISGWNPGVNATNSVIKVHSPGADYTGGAIGRNGTANFLFAANFASGAIEIFDGNFASVPVPAGAFHDSQIPGSFAPFNIRNIGGRLYVTYARSHREDQDDDGSVASRPERDNDDDANGFVDVFDTAGTLLQRIRSDSLQKPWGVAIAPADFGFFSKALLIGNVKSGRIAAFDAISGQFLGFLRGERRGRPLSIDGLFGLEFGNGANAGPRNVLFFSAAPDEGEHGLFGSLTPVI